MQFLCDSAWPPYLYRVCLGGSAQANVQAEITLRNVAAAASNFLGLLVAVRADGHSSADGIAIRTCASQFQ